MADFLSREKEFMKMNADLNHKTKTVLEKPDSKYQTFTKKVPIILNKGNDRLRILARAPSKAQDTSPSISPQPPPAGYDDRSAKSWPSKFTTVPRNMKECTGHGVTKKYVPKPKIGDAPPERKSPTLRSAVPPTGRTMAPNLNKRSPILVTEKYKNKNFQESPSLEELIRMESESQKYSKSQHNFGDHKRDSVREDVSDTRLPKKNLSSDGLIKFLKSKVAILQDELETNCHDLAKKVDELTKSYDKQKKLETQRDQAFSKNNQLLEQFTKLQEKYDSTEKRLKEREQEFAAISKQCEASKRELKMTAQVKTNLEKRLYQTNEELENLKNTMTGLKEGERDLKDAAKAETEALEKQIKVLKKQRTDALTAYKKQLYLVDNLRRQNVCMEQARMIAFGEKEFSKVLEWNSKKS